MASRTLPIPDVKNLRDRIERTLGDATKLPEAARKRAQDAAGDVITQLRGVTGEVESRLGTPASKRSAAAKKAAAKRKRDSAARATASKASAAKGAATRRKNATARSASAKKAAATRKKNEAEKSSSGFLGL